MTATAEPTLPPPFAQVLDADIVIAGTGFAGLGMAIKLKKAGVESFVLLERALEIGGTWRDNHYPGCACDIPSELYSFSFEREFAWTRDYPTQPEILAYLQKCADTYGIRPHVRHGSEIVEARYDERAGIGKSACATGRPCGAECSSRRWAASAGRTCRRYRDSSSSKATHFTPRSGITPTI